MENLISVIVPVYNVEKYLNRCVDSIINQTYSNLEIILVDDGSKDLSPKICDELAKKDIKSKDYYRYFRVIQTGSNWAGNRWLYLLKVDIWGKIK